MTIINLTPHPIVLKTDSIEKTFEPSGVVARVTSEMKEVDPIDDIPFVTQVFGEVQGIPEAKENTLYIVSSIVASASDRKDLIVPNTMQAERDEKGRIQSVPSFIKKD